MKNEQINTIIGVVLLGLAAIGMCGAFENIQALYGPKYSNASSVLSGVGLLFDLAVSLVLATVGTLLLRRSNKKNE